MQVRWRRWSCWAYAGVLYLALAAAACAQVVVTVDGDTAYATISLEDNGGNRYEADVTIVFDTPLNLTPQSLNLTAELVDPAAIDSRLPPNDLFGGVAVDPAFPVMITVEPVDYPWLFTSGFDGDEDGSGDLSFQNTYSIEVHTHDLQYTQNSPYRLFKAPVGGAFYDITNDVLKGSMRARGRGGAFSQFVVAKDTRNALLTVALLDKIPKLHLRILAAALEDGLRLDLLALLAKVDALLLIDLTGALSALDSLIDLIDLNAGVNIANVWTAHRDLVNDAGEMDELAQTLRFTMSRIAGSASP